MKPSPCRRPADLAAAIGALEAGNWPAVTARAMQALVTSRTTAMLVAVQRATNLSRFADPTAAKIGTALWRGMGGERGVRSAALAELAARPLVPASGPGALPPEVPVRRARIEAYRRALGYRDDLGA